MQLIAPDLLAEAVGLSPFLCGLGIFLGLMLWLLGWRAHRFWIVLLTTVLAGVYGLSSAPHYHSQPLLSGVLLAIASGVLALALIRVIAFFAGGVAGCLLVHALAPSWGEPLVFFLLGGMLGLILFRLWTMTLTSMAGALLVAYSSLCLADRLGKLQAVPWADRERLLLNWACGVFALAGVFCQFTLERRRARKQAKDQKKAAAPPPAPPAPPPAPPAPPPRLKWLRNLGGKIMRRAG
jgi:hypothetical protein